MTAPALCSAREALATSEIRPVDKCDACGDANAERSPSW